MNSNYLAKGERLFIGQVPMTFEPKEPTAGIDVYRFKGQMYVQSKFPMNYLPMTEMAKARESGMEIPDSMYLKVAVDSLVILKPSTLYNVGGDQFVYKQLIPNARKMLVPSGRKDTGLDYLTIKVSDGQESKIIRLEGGMGQIGEEEAFFMNGSNYRFLYGSVPIKLPFSLACNQFVLDRYPGSDAPSSFESTVTVFDPKKETNHKQRIFMNNVMDYDGYRFFQSGYFPDESGTILSVNHDWWGTNVTYIGYLLMAIGMVMSIFAKAGRFRDMIRKLDKLSDKRKTAAILAFGLMISMNSFAQDVDHKDHSGHDHSMHDEHAHDHNHDHAAESGANFSKDKKEIKELPISFIAEDHSDKLAHLLMQDFDGRIAPFHTICDELLRKIHRKNTYTAKDGRTYNAVQTILSMHMSPERWMDEKIVYVSKALREKLGVVGNYASINNLLKEDKSFKLAAEYEISHNKLDKNKGEFDKQLVKLVERYQIIAAFPAWTYLKMVPVRADKKRTWFAPMDNEVFANEEGLFRSSMEYFKNLFEAIGSKDYTKADVALNDFIKLQREAAGELAPSKSKVALEVSYNKMQIFKRVQYLYLLLGLGLLILFFIRILANADREEGKGMKWVKRIFTWSIVVVFVYHGAGLLMRWNISGHAPWSNGYEALIFIAFVTMLAGLLFSNKNAVIIAAAAILAFFIIFVTEMNLLDPEITPLQPVLKSYWLMIHVAIITGSYGFLGLGAIVGFVNLLLYIFRTKENSKVLGTNISELTYISEMTITIGLFMLTIGTFLGGIWANESWGRYWGWDPKETWALVSVLVYAVILHLRFIPALKNKFTFNLVSFWGYTSILFTFFGVNFYLVGLHSYAQGDGLAEIPSWILMTFVGLYIFTEFAWLRYKRFVSTTNELNLKFFAKKVGFLLIGFYLVYLFLWITSTVETSRFITMVVFTGVLFIATNALLFLIQKLYPNKENNALSEF